MKTYYCAVRVSSQARKAIENTISTNEKYSNSYFFHPGVTASERRERESAFHRENQPYRILRGLNTIMVSYYYRESCKNVYYSLTISVNDEKKDIKVLKKLLV